MKRALNTLVLFAATALAFSACIKPEIEAQPSEEDCYYTFVIGSPETRSILASDDQGKFGQWENNDRLGTAVNDLTPGYSAVVINEDAPVTFSIYKQGGLKKDDVIYAYYPYKSNISSKTAVPFEIPENQSQNGETFDYDAMPMAAAGFVVSEDLANSSSSSTTPVGEINLYNLGSVIDFQVFSSNETYAAETILSVKFSASGAISGSFTKDISTIQANDASSLTISGFTGTEVTTSVNNAPSMGSTRNDAAHIYMVIGPSSGITGSVIVTTNKAVYTYNMSTAQTFKRAGLKTFGLNLGTCQNRVAQEILTASYTISDILNRMGKSNVAAGTKVNPLYIDDVVTMSTTGTTNNAKVYGTYPSQDWRIYAQGNGDVVISVARGYELKSVKFTYTTNNSPTFNGPTSGTEASVNGSSVTYNVTNKGNILITAVEVKYALSSTTTYDFETIASLNQLVTNTSADLFGRITEAIVSFVPSPNDAIIKDDTGSILLHSTGHGLLPGQTFTGNLNVSAQLYNGCSEITSCDATFTGTEIEVAPANVTISDLVGNLSTYQNAYVKVENLTVTNVTNNSNKGTINVTDGTNNYVVYTSYGDATCAIGDHLTVEGTIAHYGNNDQIKVWSADDIEVTGHTTPSYTISISAPSEPGCSISATVDNTPISSGATVETGKTVNLTATVGTGYTFTSWVVEGAEVTSSTSTTTSFVVANSNVSISASFSGGNIDILNRSLTEVSGSSYSEWDNVQSNTNARYAGCSAGSNSSIQLRSQSPSGIVTTTSGGYATKVTVTWESHTQAGRTLNIYGKNSPYTSSADLYGDNKGSLLGTIVCGESTVFAIPYDCQYIGLCSAEGAMYLSEIQIEWSQNESGIPIPTPTYSLTLPSNVTGGSIVANKTSGIEAGETVTLTIDPDDNYELQTLMVDNSNVTSSVNSDGQYTFNMPSHNVTVTVSFSYQGSGGIVPTNGTCFNLTSYNSIPDGWSSEDVLTGSYFRVEAGGFMISPAYDLTGCSTATVSIKVAKYGNGTDPAAILSVSYDGGTTWTESKTLTAPTKSTYLSAQTLTLNNTFTNNVVIKLENPTGNADLRVQNFSFTVNN